VQPSDTGFWRKLFNVTSLASGPLGLGATLTGWINPWLGVALMAWGVSYIVYEIVFAETVVQNVPGMFRLLFVVILGSVIIGIAGPRLQAKLLANEPSAAQSDEIKQLDELFSGQEEYDLHKFFAFDQMVDLNMRMYAARIRYFQRTGQISFDITPYAANQSLSIDTSVAGEHLTRQANGQIFYDLDPNQIAFIVLPQKYSENKKALTRYENSITLASSIVISVKDFDNTLDENTALLIKVMDVALKEKPGLLCAL